MSSDKDIIFNPPLGVSSNAHVASMSAYKSMHDFATRNPEEFWEDISKNFHFESKFTGKFLDYNFDCTKGKIFIKWMEGAKTNICYNCIDKHILEGKGDQTAFFWLVLKEEIHENNFIYW